MAKLEGTPTREALTAEIDHLSLEQALLDFEIANARVLDLTQRLVEAQAQLTELRTEHEMLRLEHAQLTSLHEQMKGSTAFRTAQKIWGLRNALGV